jgi:hypothetical protein
MCGPWAATVTIGLPYTGRDGERTRVNVVTVRKREETIK